MHWEASLCTLPCRILHINAIYVFSMFASLLLLVIVECVACCKQQTAARENLETAVRWNAIYLESNHKYEQLVKEVKDDLPKKKYGMASKHK